MTPASSPMYVRLPARQVTLDDVAVLAAADDGHRYELAGGHLVIRPPDDADHDALVTRLVRWLTLAGRPVDRPLGGLRVDQSTGRSPDLVLLRRVAPAGTWVDPREVSLVVEVVSSSSRRRDRFTKPVEYASVGIPHFWRVERDGGPVTVHMYQLGTGENGEPAYVGHRAVLFDELLAGDPPELG